MLLSHLQAMIIDIMSVEVAFEEIRCTEFLKIQNKVVNCIQCFFSLSIAIPNAF